MLLPEYNRDYLPRLGSASRFKLDQRFERGGIFDLLALALDSWMLGDHLSACEHPHLMQ